MSLQVGIEYLGFSTSKTSFSLELLAKKRHTPKTKYTQGLGQTAMSVITPQEDIITLSHDAFYDAIDNITNKNNELQTIKNEIELLLFATESGVDNSKSASCELHTLLQLSPNCRCLEIKHACYGGTGAFMLACDFVKAHPTKKALVIMSDIAFYGLHSSGEPTQGCGAVAIVISNQPKIAVFNDDNVVLTKNTNDFYRPYCCQKPICDGHLSIKSYLEMFHNVYDEYKAQRNTFDYLITHSPFTKMLYKCCKELNIDNDKNENEAITKYNKLIGNSYTASLYIGLISLLENSKNNLAGKKVIMFSYGSGAECEIFSLTILPDYINYLNKNKHITALQNRTPLTYKEYKTFLQQFQRREKKLNWKLARKYNKYNTMFKNNSFDNNLLLYKIEKGIRFYKVNTDKNKK